LPAATVLPTLKAERLKATTDDRRWRLDAAVQAISP
jgi:hypothetical protein